MSMKFIIPLALHFAASPAYGQTQCGDDLLAADEDDEIDVIREAYKQPVIVPATYKNIVQEIIVEEARCPDEDLKDVEVWPQDYLDNPPVEPCRRLQLHPAIFEIVIDSEGRPRKRTKEPWSSRYVAVGCHPRIAIFKKRDPDAVNNVCSPDEMIPAVTRTFERRVVDVPATVKIEIVPERVELISVRVIRSALGCGGE